MWLSVVFWILLIPLIVFLIITYAKTRKLYGMFYLLSIFTYVMTMLFAIDKYGSNKTTVLVILILSAAVMIMLGAYFAKKRNTSKKIIKK